MRRDQIQIALRIVAKECLRKAFRASGAWWKNFEKVPDTHGEFGLAGQFDGRRDDVTPAPIAIRAHADGCHCLNSTVGAAARGRKEVISYKHTEGPE